EWRPPQSGRVSPCCRPLSRLTNTVANTTGIRNRLLVIPDYGRASTVGLASTEVTARPTCRPGDHYSRQDGSAGEARRRCPARGRVTREGREMNGPQGFPPAARPPKPPPVSR